MSLAMDGDSSQITGPAALILPVLNLFRDFNVAVTLAGAIGLAGLLILVWFVLVVMLPAIWQVDRLTRRVRATNGAAAFSANFAEIDRAFASAPLLRHGWAKLRQTLILPSQGATDPIRHSAPPGQFINVGAAEAAGLNLRFYQAVPNYFVGIGLVFTFLGLVAALFFASQGVGASDVKVAQRSLGYLLQASTFKFLTSIAGLVASLALSIGYRILVLRLTRGIDRLVRALDQRLVLVDAIGIGLAQTNELRRQNKLLEGLGTEIAKRLEDSLPALIADAVGPLAQAGDPGALRGVMEEMQAGLSRTGARETTALAEILVELRTSLRGFGQTLAQTGSDFGQRIDGASVALQGQVSDSSRLLAETLSAVDQTAIRLRTASEPVARIADKFQIAASEISGAADRMAKIQGEMSGTLRTLNESANTLKAFWTEYRTRFEEVDRGLAGAFTAFAEGSETHRKATESFVKEMDAEMARALTALGSGIDELTTTVEDLKSSVKEIGGSLGRGPVRAPAAT